MKKSHLNHEQQIAVDHINGPMMVVAGPGSGKTHLLIERLYNLIENGVKPSNILVITFSKKAALEMESRYRNYAPVIKESVNFGTFHAVFFNILRYHNLYDSDGILDNGTKFKFIEHAGVSLGITSAAVRSWQITMLENISFLKNIGDINALKNYRNLDEGEVAIFMKVYDRYNKMCREEKRLDFDDMVFECKKLLENNEGARKIWQNKFSYILIDEFQDINSVQYEVIKLLCSEKKNVFAVGDDDQSIYGFRGAMPSIMNRFMEDFSPCEKVILKLNYRSCFQVVEAADILIRNNKMRIERERQNTLKNRKGGAVIRRIFATFEDEANYVMNEINKYNPGDVAIIFRSDFCGSLIEERIRESGICYNKKVENLPFYELEASQILISFLKCSIDEAELSDYLRIINVPERNISRESVTFGNRPCIETIREYYKKSRIDDNDERYNKITKLISDMQTVRSLPLKAGLIYILKGMGVYDYLLRNFKVDIRNPVTFDEFIEHFKRDTGKFESVEAFIKYIESRDKKREVIHKEDNNTEKEKTKKAVTFVTAHASKGLEYPVVFIIGLQEGIFPHRKNLEGQSLEEERRLFYVAMTRAKEKLYLCGVGSEYGKIPSRFIDETETRIPNQSFIASNSSLSRNSSKASATASYSSSSSM